MSLLIIGTITVLLFLCKARVICSRWILPLRNSILPGFKRDLEQKRSFSLFIGSTGFIHIAALGIGGLVGEGRSKERERQKRRDEVFKCQVQGDSQAREDWTWIASASQLFYLQYAPVTQTSSVSNTPWHTLSLSLVFLLFNNFLVSCWFVALSFSYSLYIPSFKTHVWGFGKWEEKKKSPNNF